MTYKNRSKTGAGFTIIEVLIVLAIAGLILLIVFLAVPALQRNSRNTAIKNDVQNVLGGVSEFQGANNGRLPQSIDGTGTINYTFGSSSGGNSTSINVQGSTKVTSGTNAAPADIPNGEIYVRIGYSCGGASGPVSNTRAVSAYFSIETSNDPTVRQCQDS